MKIAASLLALLVTTASAQEDGTRQLWNTEFLKKRPEGPAPASATPHPAAHPKYKPVAPSFKTPAVTTPVGSGTMIGVTLWRIREATSADQPGSRLLVLPRPGEQKSATQERIDISSRITKSDGYRFTFEIPIIGYLYVIDREKYADGKMSDPYLIYPNWQTHAGDNVVAPGRLLEIPDRREVPNFFSIDAKPGQVAEVISFLVTPEPVPNLSIGNKPMRIDPGTYAGWEKKAAVKPERYELEGGTGAVISEAENQAGADPGTKVTQNDPLPETLYRVNAKPGTPILIEIPLNFK
jgi:hypothetical protein